MTEEEKHRLIEVYLSGRASEAEVRQLDNLRSKDPAFQREFDEQQILWQAIGPSQTNAFRNTVAEVLEEQRPKRKNSFFRINPWLGALVASVLLVVITSWWFLTPLTDPPIHLFDQYFTMPPATAFSRNPIGQGPTNAAIQWQQSIDSLYRLTAYREALSQLEQFGTQFPQARSSKYHFLQGLLYLSLDRPEAALIALAEVKVGYPYDQRWYTGLAYLKMGETAEAKMVFQPLAQESNPYREEAAAILAGLSE